jgi:hypothetical protein
MLPVTLPFALLGVLLALKHIRQPSYHTLLIALLCAPAGAILAEVTITRELVFVIPATLLTAVGWERVLQWGEQRLKWSRLSLGIGVFLVLTGMNVAMLQDALRNGPTWFTDYGLGGLQYGAKQLFEETIPSYLNSNPNRQVMVSPVWANGTDVFAQFFLTPEQQKRVQMYNIDYFLFAKRPLTPDTVLVMTVDEYERAQKEQKFKTVETLQTVLYPDGSPGFYFSRLAYADTIDQIFQAERDARRQLIAGTVTASSEVVQVLYSPLGSGQLKDIFDQDPFTLVRGLEANPLILDLTFPSAHALQSIALQVGTMEDFTLTVLAYPAGNKRAAVYTQTYQKLPADPRVEIQLTDGPEEIVRLRIELTNNLAGETAQIHIRDVSWR